MVLVIERTVVFLICLVPVCSLAQAQASTRIQAQSGKSASTRAPAAKKISAASHAGDFAKFEATIESAMVESAKRDIANKAYGHFLALSVAYPTDYVARSYAGYLAAQRCAYTVNQEERATFLQEGLPLLEQAVEEAKKSGSNSEKYVVYRNRADIYSILPAILEKQNVALTDSEEMMRIVDLAGMTAVEKLRARLIRVRCLARADRSKEAKGLMTQIRKDPLLGSEKLRYELKTAEEALATKE